jgi:5-oxoprolinase (ATP-hydrolysing) subunit A
MQIDINSDIGEGFGPYRIADDESLFRLITSANVACGFHAGDPTTMDRTIGLAKDHGVALGAHVGYADRVGFGRRRMDVAPQDLRNEVLYQLGALHALARVHGSRITHMSAHGALGNLASADRGVAETIVAAGSDFDPDIVFVAMSGSAMDAAVRDAGRRVVNVFLADRAYRADGQLAPRARPDAMIKDLQEVRRRVVRAMRDGLVDTIDGGTLTIAARSVLVHSDTANAVALATTIREAIAEIGGVSTPLSNLPLDT